MDTLQLPFLQGGKLVHQGNRLSDQLLKANIIVFTDHSSAISQEGDDLFRYLTKIIFLYRTQRAEIIIDMIFHRFCQATDTEYDLAGEVISLIIIKPLLHGDIVIQLGNAKRTDTFHLFQVNLLLLHGSQDLAQLTEVLIHESIYRLAEYFRRKIQIGL